MAHSRRERVKLFLFLAVCLSVVVLINLHSVRADGCGEDGVTFCCDYDGCGSNQNACAPGHCTCCTDRGASDRGYPPANGWCWVSEANGGHCTGSNSECTDSGGAVYTYGGGVQCDTGSGSTCCVGGGGPPPGGCSNNDQCVTPGAACKNEQGICNGGNCEYSNWSPDGTPDTTGAETCMGAGQICCAGVCSTFTCNNPPSSCQIEAGTPHCDGTCTYNNWYADNTKDAVGPQFCNGANDFCCAYGGTSWCLTCGTPDVCTKLPATCWWDMWGPQCNYPPLPDNSQDAVCTGTNPSKICCGGGCRNCGNTPSCKVTPPTCGAAGTCNWPNNMADWSTDTGCNGAGQHCCSGSCATCNNPPACKDYVGSCAGIPGCNYPNLPDNTQDNQAPNFCNAANHICCGGGCRDCGAGMPVCQNNPFCQGAGCGYNWVPNNSTDPGRCDAAHNICCNGGCLDCSSPPVCKTFSDGCAGGACVYPNIPDSQPDNEAPNLWNGPNQICCGGANKDCGPTPTCRDPPPFCWAASPTGCDFPWKPDSVQDPNGCDAEDQTCCGGACQGNLCPTPKWCADTYGPPTNKTGDGDIIRAADDAYCIYSATDPRVIFYTCANPKTCSAQCGTVEDRTAETFCKYCHYNLVGNLTQLPRPFAVNWTNGVFARDETYPCPAGEDCAKCPSKCLSCPSYCAGCDDVCYNCPYGCDSCNTACFGCDINPNGTACASCTPNCGRCRAECLTCPHGCDEYCNSACQDCNVNCTYNQYCYTHPNACMVPITPSSYSYTVGPLNDSACADSNYQLGFQLSWRPSMKPPFLGIEFNDLTIHNSPTRDITSFVTVKAPKINRSLPQSPHSIVGSMFAHNHSTVRAFAARFDTSVADLYWHAAGVPIGFSSYNISIQYNGSMIPDNVPPGVRQAYIDSMDIYKLNSINFDFPGEEVLGAEGPYEVWLNANESGAGLEKWVEMNESNTTLGINGSVKASGYGSFSAFAIGAMLLPIGAACGGDADCLSGCCGTPTVHGTTYCVKCIPPPCDPGFCSCEPDFADKCTPPCTPGDPACPSDCHITNDGDACGGWCDPKLDPNCPPPVGCRDDSDCVLGAYCMTRVIDRMIDPTPEQMCTKCSTKQDGYCASRNCVGFDPDCCNVTLYSPPDPDGDCSGFGALPPYFCENMTIDRLPLNEGTCRACDNSGSRDQYVPDVVCMGHDADSCNSTMPCPDTNTYCVAEPGFGSLEDGTCSFGTCLVKRGNFCNGETEAQDCNSDTYCARQAHLCASKCCLFVSPSAVSAKVGDVITIRAVLNDPVGEERTYNVRILDSGVAGSGAPFAKFQNGFHSITVTVPKDGRKEVPLEFRAAATGKYTIILAVNDKEFSAAAYEGINSNQCLLTGNRVDILVEGEANNLEFLSAPGPGVAELGIMVGLAGVIFILIDRRRK